MPATSPDIRMEIELDATTHPKRSKLEISPFMHYYSVRWVAKAGVRAWVHNTITKASGGTLTNPSLHL